VPKGVAMTDAARDFPSGSIRRAVARLGDVWWLAFEDPEGVAQNEHFVAELHDIAVMRRCFHARGRGATSAVTAGGAA